MPCDAADQVESGGGDLSSIRLVKSKVREFRSRRNDQGKGGVLDVTLLEELDAG